MRDGERLLVDGGTLALEVDPATAGLVRKRLATAAWVEGAVLADLAGLSRVVVARRRRP